MGTRLPQPEAGIEDEVGGGGERFTVWVLKGEDATTTRISKDPIA